MTPISLPGRVRSRGLLWSLLLTLAALLLFTSAAFAQVAPSHDPSRMIRNTDGRYWIFTTGNGVFAMSSPNADFTGWRVEPTVFPAGTWPSWINNYVSGFGGNFWAPDVIKVGSTFRLYYSCAGQGAPAAIGLATATNLARRNDGMRAGWTWRLPPKMPNASEDAKDAKQKTLAPLAPSAASSLVEVEI